MAKKTPKRNHGKASAFQELGFEAVIADLQEEVRELYCADSVPWIIGYSGGKDSTAVLQLVWSALAELPKPQRHKPVHVISTDTLVENPVVSAWVAKSLDTMRDAAKDQDLPIEAHKLTPAVVDSFWVNLIGKGYPAPRHKFRWCTERLKIKPSNGFISDVVTKNGEAILLLGVRKSESAARAKVMKRNAEYRVRDHLSPSGTLAGCMIYSPVESWSNDDVWFYLMQAPNPWGYNNRDLLGMYAGATEDGECPLVVDDTTPSCGTSRFGCWVCTLVEKDRSMSAMVQNDAELEWMQPLLELRNLIDFREDGVAKDRSTGELRPVNTKLEAFRSPVGKALGEFVTRKTKRSLEDIVRDKGWERKIRDFRRLKTGHVQIMKNGKHVPGPYIQEARECWLRALLTAQTAVRELGPESVKDLELINQEELEEIRRIWVIDKHELEDRLPIIYKETTGQSYPGRSLDENLVLGEEEMLELKELCEEDELHYELTRNLLGLTVQKQNQARRHGVFQDIEKMMQRSYYEGEEDALERARSKAKELSPDSPPTKSQPELDQG